MMAAAHSECGPDHLPCLDQLAVSDADRAKAAEVTARCGFHDRELDVAIAVALAEARAPYDRLTADLRALAEELERAAVESKRRTAATVWINEYESAVAHTLEATAARLRAVVDGVEGAKA